MDRTKKTLGTLLVIVFLVLSYRGIDSSPNRPGGDAERISKSFRIPASIEKPSEKSPQGKYAKSPVTTEAPPDQITDMINGVTSLYTQSSGGPLDSNSEEVRAVSRRYLDLFREIDNDQVLERNQLLLFAVGEPALFQDPEIKELIVKQMEIYYSSKETDLQLTSKLLYHSYLSMETRPEEHKAFLKHYSELFERSDFKALEDDGDKI